ncbi:MAG: hypothetical protein LIP08_14805 [Bacteroides sp.]|nr:hypothetical protein [Bacteroides sp.]
MKTNLFILMLFAMLLTACSSDDNSKEETFFVNVYTQYSPEDAEELANPEITKSYVYLFDDASKQIDTSKSLSSVYRENLITYTDGSTEKYLFKSPTSVSAHILEDIPHGKYTLFVVLTSYNGLVQGASSKSIVVNKDYNAKTEKKVFLYRGILNGNYGYQTWDEKW